MSLKDFFDNTSNTGFLKIEFPKTGDADLPAITQLLHPFRPRMLTAKTQKRGADYHMTHRVVGNLLSKETQLLACALNCIITEKVSSLTLKHLENIDRSYPFFAEHVRQLMDFYGRENVSRVQSEGQIFGSSAFARPDMLFVAVRDGLYDVHVFENKTTSESNIDEYHSVSGTAFPMNPRVSLTAPADETYFSDQRRPAYFALAQCTPVYEWVRGNETLRGAPVYCHLYTASSDSADETLIVVRMTESLYGAIIMQVV